MTTTYDAVIIGGGAAGLSAALTLGRARRRVLVIDKGEPRNRDARAMHGFLSRDGVDPDALYEASREQLAQYDGVEILNGQAASAARNNGLFTVNTRDRTFASRTLVIATGVRDAIPEIEGLLPLWGRSIFTCPYCDGWEVRDGRIATFGTTRSGVELAKELSQWSSDLLVCSDLKTSITVQEREWLEKNRVPVKHSKIRRLIGLDGALRAIEFEDGESIERDALFLSVGLEQHSNIAERLGCRLTAEGQIAVDDGYRTTVPGAYAAGDAVTHLHQVVFAAASGARAAIALNNDLMGIV